jgi:hypothetical protein
MRRPPALVFDERANGPHPGSALHVLVLRLSPPHRSVYGGRRASGRTVLLNGDLALKSARKIQLYDLVFGVAACVIFVVGLLRGKRVMARVSAEDPAAYCKDIISLLPKEHRIDSTIEPTLNLAGLSATAECLERINASSSAHPRSKPKSPSLTACG